jgi:hypothetical protein
LLQDLRTRISKAGDLRKLNLTNMDKKQPDYSGRSRKATKRIKNISEKQESIS